MVRSPWSLMSKEDDEIKRYAHQNYPGIKKSVLVWGLGDSPTDFLEAWKNQSGHRIGYWRSVKFVTR